MFSTEHTFSHRSPCLLTIFLSPPPSAYLPVFRLPRKLLTGGSIVSFTERWGQVDCEKIVRRQIARRDPMFVFVFDAVLQLMYPGPAFPLDTLFELPPTLGTGFDDGEFDVTNIRIAFHSARPLRTIEYQRNTYKNSCVMARGLGRGFGRGLCPLTPATCRRGGDAPPFTR